MIMQFEPRLRGLWSIRLLEVDLSWEPFRVPLPEDSYLSVEELRVTNQEFDLRNCYGSLNRETGEMSLHLRIILDPERIPQLRELGVSAPLNFEVVEEGRMDWVTGRIQTHAAPFQLPSGLPEGLLSVQAGQSHCEAFGYLFVAAGDAPQISEELIIRYGPKWVRVCPGTPVLLAFEIDNFSKASTVEITAPGIPAITVTQPHGSVTVPAPASDTTFTLVVKDTNGCETKSYVDVFVVYPGMPVRIQATKNPESSIWSASLPALNNDPKIMVTSICSYLCPSEDTMYADWSVYQTEIDGAVNHVNVTDTPLPMAPIPLAGMYEFQPENTGHLLPDDYQGLTDPAKQNVACFVATVACPR